MNDPKIVVALDFADQKKANQFIDQIEPGLCKLKVGKEMFTHFGPQWVKTLVDRGFDVFLDLKFHDIPNTVAKACIAAADLGVWMVNVHAFGGSKMMENARMALEAYGAERPKLIAVTVLTSMDQQQLSEVGINVSPEQQVTRLADLTYKCGLDGVVCSALEASLLREKFNDEFLLVTPGIRPIGADQGDQSRIMTPQQAVKAGVSYMVIGRPITQSDDPLKTLLTIQQSIK